MKILLAPLLLAVSLPAFAEVDSKIHKLCIEAKDYAGCVKAQGAMKGSDAASSGISQLRSKEMYDKLYDFNKRQFIVKNPTLGSWVKSNPKLAKEPIEKEFLFFSEKDYKSSQKLYDICKRRGKTIDIEFKWAVPCSVVNKENTISGNNKWLKDSIITEIKREFRVSSLKEKCAAQNKELKYDRNAQGMCMTDFEYKNYLAQQRKRVAEEQNRARMNKQRKNNAIRRALQGISNSLGQFSSPNTYSVQPSAQPYSVQQQQMNMQQQRMRSEQIRMQQQQQQQQMQMQQMQQQQRNQQLQNIYQQSY